MNIVRFVTALLISWVLLSVVSAESYTPGQQVNKSFGEFAKAFLASHCVDCHGDTEPEGNLSLDNLGRVTKSTLPPGQRLGAGHVERRCRPKMPTSRRSLNGFSFLTGSSEN